ILCVAPAAVERQDDAPSPVLKQKRRSRWVDSHPRCRARPRTPCAPHGLISRRTRPLRMTMKKHTTDLLGTFRKAVKRIFAGTGGIPRPTTKLAYDVLEDRSLLAAPFFAPAEPSGSVNVQLVPLGNVTPGSQEIVTFGVPFTRGSLSQSQLSQLRVLKN